MCNISGTVENGVDRVVLETRDGRDIKQGQGERVLKQYSINLY